MACVVDGSGTTEGKWRDGDGAVVVARSMGEVI